MDSQSDKVGKREVSYFGPIYIRNTNSRMELSVPETEPGSYRQETESSNSDNDTIPDPIDVSKYKILQRPIERKKHDQLSSPKRFLHHVGVGMGTVRVDSLPARDPDRYISPTHEDKNTDRYGEVNHIKEAKPDVHFQLEKGKNANRHYPADSRIGLQNDCEREKEDTSHTKVNDADVNNVLERLDRAILDEVVGDCSFKISSSEDNYVMNKYRAKTLVEFEDDTDKFMAGYYKNKMKANTLNGSGDDAQEKIRTQESSPETETQGSSPKTETLMKHRSRIARLKRKFFESSPPKQNGRWLYIGTKGKHKSVNGKPLDEPCTENKSNDKCETSTEMKDQYAPVKPPRAPMNVDNHYATESKATMQRTLAKEKNERHRRHSSEGVLGRVDVIEDINRRWSMANLTADPNSPHIAVVAIDFGTTYSGYAYSFTHDPDTVHLMRRQEGGDPGLFNQKTPTTILLTPDGKFHSFGYAARDSYHDLDPKDAPKWMYFDRFKMLLHNDGFFSKESVLRTVAGKEMSAMKIFAYSLAYFKDLALQELSDQSGFRITCDIIRWVITVPAIWKASAKQFMRQAAYEAGIVPHERPDQLLIALEPEAASIYCRRLRMFQMMSHDSGRVSLSDISCTSSLSLPELKSNDVSIRSHDLAVGTRYMVVDCGGGTVDITVHELLSDGRLKELHRASGGAHGSVGVDEEFEKLLAAVFGQDIIEQFKRKRPSAWVDLMAMFESRKRTASPYRSSNISVSFPFAFIDFYKKCRVSFVFGLTPTTLPDRIKSRIIDLLQHQIKNGYCSIGSSMESAVKKFGDDDVSWVAGGMLRLAPGAMRRLFLPTIDRIKQAIGSVLNNPNTRDLSYMFLVGGFAESSVIQHEMRKDFGDLLKVIIPPGVGMTILKGAVYFGLDPNTVHERCSCLTYGVGVLHRFNPTKHPPEKIVSKDGIDWCTDIFDTFVQVNQSIAMGDIIVRRYTPVRRQQTTTSIHIYSSEKADVKYITDEGVIRCGTLTLNLPGDVTVSNSGERREIRTEMKFGGTEIKVKATDVKTGHSVEADIDFINS